jgi:hypothetical protein
MSLNKTEKQEVYEILVRRASEITNFRNSYVENDDHFGSVELALTREIERLHRLADKIL